MSKIGFRFLLAAGVVVGGLSLGAVSGLVVRAILGPAAPTPAAAVAKSSAEDTVLPKAERLVRAERYTDAAQVLESYVAKFPQNADGWYWYAQALVGTGAPGKAIPAFDRAMKLDATNDDAAWGKLQAQLTHGYSLWDADRREAATMLFENALKAARKRHIERPDDPDAALMRALAAEAVSRDRLQATRMLLEAGKAEEAQPLADALDALLGEGILHARLTCTKRLDDFTARDTEAGLLLRRAYLYEALQRPDEAIGVLSESLRAYEHALDLSPSDEQAQKKASDAKRLFSEWSIGKDI